MKYNLLKSKTFWTLMLMFAGDIVAVYGKMLSPDQMILLNLVLTGLANYFHLSTAKKFGASN